MSLVVSNKHIIFKLTTIDILCTFQILHVVGSPKDEFNFTLNVFYASAFDPQRHDDFAHLWAVVRPTDQKWSFANVLSDVVDVKSKKLIPSDDVQWFDLAMALSMISNVIRPTLIVPHMFCSQGTTVYKGLFEVLKIPFIGSSSEKATCAINKAATKAILMEGGIPVPPGQNLTKGSSLRFNLMPKMPCVVKPVDSENSLGVTLVNSLDEMNKALAIAYGFSNEVIVDKFIHGREIRCSVIEKTLSNGQIEKVVLIPQEYIVDKSKIRSTEDKLQRDQRGLPLGNLPICGFKQYVAKFSNFSDKAPSTKTRFLSMTDEGGLIKRIQQVALEAHTKLQFRDFSMFDMRLDQDGNPYILEANLFCSFGLQSVLVSHAAQMGYDDKDLFKIMVNNVLHRSK